MDDLFFGRKPELALLDRLWDSARGALLILYGRRRVGKTSLLTHWMTSRKHPTLYWVAFPSSKQEQIRSFSRALYSFTHDGSEAPPNYTLENWEYAWKEAAALAAQTRLAIFIDEFTYLLETDPAIAGILQNTWDHTLKKTNLLLAISGSHLGMMHRQVLSYQAPLYGRATAQIHLQPLPFGMTKSYFPRHSASERVAIYAIFGGIPAYWERIDQSVSLSDSIQDNLLTPNHFMQNEPQLLLHDFVREPHNYMAVLRAIAQNARTQKEISVRTGLHQSHISKYLSVLREAGFVERRTPVTAGPNSRLGRYHIQDPYLRFYYRFLATRQEQFAQRRTQAAWQEIQRHLGDFIGVHTWEELCREWLLGAGEAQVVPFLPDQVGSGWTKKAQVDVVGMNTMEKTIYLGECKWGEAPAGRKVLRDLAARTQEIVPKQGRWQVFYLGFARAGWTEAAQAYSQGVLASLSGENWQAAGSSLFNLDQIEYDLVEWTH